MRNYLNHNSPRPWPVDPREYPLSGPSSGPAYCPEPYRMTPLAHAVRALAWGAVAVAFMCGMFAVYAVIEYLSLPINY